MFSPQNLKCCICGKDFEASVGSGWHRFEQGVCGPQCFNEKEWRKACSTLGNPYRPDPRYYPEDMS